MAKNKLKKIYPYPASDLDRSASELKLHNVLSPDASKSGENQTIRDETIVIKDTNTGKIYGMKTLKGKSTQNESLKLLNLTLESSSNIEKDIEESLTDLEITEVKKNIRKGANDLNQQWANALELTHKAYQVARVALPQHGNKEAWAQYVDLITYAVKNLARTRGLAGKWRMTSLGLK